MFELDLGHLEVPRGYDVRLDQQGRKYYVNLDTGAESWRHPGKLKALQELGIVDSPDKRRTVPTILEALNDFSVEVPPPWVRVMSQGVVGYFNTDDEAMGFEHPYANSENVFPPWVRVQEPNGGVYFWNEDEQRSQIESPYAKIRSDALQAANDRELDYWVERGRLPPWIIEEKAVAQGGQKRKRYLVDYRTGSIVSNLEVQRPQKEENDSCVVC